MLIMSVFFSILFAFVFISDYIEIETRAWRKEGFDFMRKKIKKVVDILICIIMILGFLIIAQKTCYNHTKEKFINKEAELFSEYNN